jgi:hypothetical protein
MGYSRIIINCKMGHFIREDKLRDGHVFLVLFLDFPKGAKRIKVNLTEGKSAREKLESRVFQVRSESGSVRSHDRYFLSGRKSGLKDT